MSASQRRVPRKKINRSLGLLFRGEYSLGRILQVGEGGIMLQTDLALEVSDRVLVTFSLRGEQFISTKGTIRYRNIESKSLGQYGVEFDELPFQARREIRSFVASHSEIKTRF